MACAILNHLGRRDHTHHHALRGDIDNSRRRHHHHHHHSLPLLLRRERVAIYFIADPANAWCRCVELCIPPCHFAVYISKMNEQMRSRQLGSLPTSDGIICSKEHDESEFHTTLAQKLDRISQFSVTNSYGLPSLI